MAKEFPSVCYHDTIHETLDDIDSAIIVTDWAELKEFFANNNPDIPIIDGRGIYPDAVRSIGRTRIKDLI
jgi:hypothetical protein